MTWASVSVSAASCARRASSLRRLSTCHATPQREAVLAHRVDASRSNLAVVLVLPLSNPKVRRGLLCVWAEATFLASFTDCVARRAMRGWAVSSHLALCPSFRSLEVFYPAPNEAPHAANTLRQSRGRFPCPSQPVLPAQVKLLKIQEECIRRHALGKGGRGAT